MPTTEYETVYLVSAGFRYWDFAPSLLLVLTIVSFFFTIRKKASAWETQKDIRVIQTVSAVLLIMLQAFLLFYSIRRQEKITTMLENKTYKTVEGNVDEYHPMPKEGHENEHFVLNGVYFEYSDFHRTGYFNNTASHGGPIWGNGQQLRLSYIEIENNNRIIKVEIRPEGKN